MYPLRENVSLKITVKGYGVNQDMLNCGKWKVHKEIKKVLAFSRSLLLVNFWKRGPVLSDPNFDPRATVIILYKSPRKEWVKHSWCPGGPKKFD